MAKIDTYEQNYNIIASNGSPKHTSYVLVGRGTPQRGVVSPLLCVVARNGILLQLNEGRVKAVAYADDIVLMFSEVFPSAISEIIKIDLRRLHRMEHRFGGQH